MSIAFLLLPDFSLILLGFVLYRMTDWDQAFWSGMEKLVYYVLFPALLFYATTRTPLDFGNAGKMVQAAMIALLGGIALGWLARPLFRPGPMLFESGVQTAFRFNSYIALAVVSRLAGDEGVGLMALIIGVAVPTANMAAVHALTRKDGGLLREMAQNPMLVSTLCGLLFNLAGLHLPEVLGATLSRLGTASIAIGLLMVGAGLRLSGLHEAKGMAAWFTAVKLLAMPALAYAAGRWLELPRLQLQVAVLFGALPTATSAYVLAARMGGNGPFVAFLISASTLLSLASLPFWLALAA